MGKKDMREQKVSCRNTDSRESGSRVSEALAVILFIMMTIMLHIIAMKVYLLAAHTDDISIYKVIGSKILGSGADPLYTGISAPVSGGSADPGEVKKARLLRSEALPALRS